MSNCCSSTSQLSLAILQLYQTTPRQPTVHRFTLKMIQYPPLTMTLTDLKRTNWRARKLSQIQLKTRRKLKVAAVSVCLGKPKQISRLSIRNWAGRPTTLTASKTSGGRVGIHSQVKF
jgi:hypothetical protein